MAALQKFKLLATPCGVGQSPRESPRRSPLVEFRRPKTTLRSLLSLNRSSRRQQEVVMVEKPRQKLKELFVSSGAGDEHQNESSGMLVSIGVPHRSKETGSSNPPWAGFRRRSLLKRKYWRPLLLTIPE